MSVSRWDPKKRRWVAYCAKCRKDLKRTRSRGRAMTAALRHDVRKHQARGVQ